MASQFISVTNAISRVRDIADIVGQLTRHPDADITTDLNMSFRTMRDIVSSCGSPVFLEPTAPAALPTAPPLAGEQYVEVDWPLNYTAIYGVDVLQQGNWQRLRQADFSQLRTLSPDANQYYELDFYTPPLAPFYWCIRKVPTAVTTVATVGKLMIFPVPSGAQSYRLWGLEIFDDISTTSLFPGHSNWHEWMILDTAIKRVIRDSNQQGSLDDLRDRALRLEALIRKELRVITGDGPISPLPRRGTWNRYSVPRMIP